MAAVHMLEGGLGAGRLGPGHPLEKGQLPMADPILRMTEVEPLRAPKVWLPVPSLSPLGRVLATLPCSSGGLTQPARVDSPH